MNLKKLKPLVASVDAAKATITSAEERYARIEKRHADAKAALESLQSDMAARVAAHRQEQVEALIDGRDCTLVDLGDPGRVRQGEEAVQICAEALERVTAEIEAARRPLAKALEELRLAIEEAAAADVEEAICALGEVLGTFTQIRQVQDRSISNWGPQTGAWSSRMISVSEHELAGKDRGYVIRTGYAALKPPHDPEAAKRWLDQLTERIRSA